MLARSARLRDGLGHCLLIAHIFTLTQARNVDWQAPAGTAPPSVRRFQQPFALGVARTNAARVVLLPIGIAGTCALWVVLPPFPVSGLGFLRAAARSGFGAAGLDIPVVPFLVVPVCTENYILAMKSHSLMTRRRSRLRIDDSISGRRRIGLQQCA